MKSRYLLIFATSLPIFAPAALADETIQLPPNWQIPAQYTPALIHETFDKEIYGLNLAYFILALTGYDSFAIHLANGEYTAAANSFAIEYGTAKVAAFTASQIVPAYPVIGVVIHVAYAMAINSLKYSLEINAFRIQHDRYFQARPYNSFFTILNLEPFDLLDGVNMTKEGNGWLFTTSGYLTPYPSGNILTPAEFYGLAEEAWLGVNIDRAQLNAESQQLQQVFLAQLAVMLAERTVVVAPLATDSASLQWDCAPGVTFHIEHSTNLDGWTRTGPYTSVTDSMQVVLPSLPPASSRFFRISCQP